MNYGFKLVYHKDIPWSRSLEKFFVNIINKFTTENSYKERHKSRSFYRRGVFGWGLTDSFSNSGEIVYTFKRLARTSRTFGVIPVSHLQGKIDLKQCRCALHLGGQRVKLLTPYKDEDYIKVFETGLIRG